MFQEQFLNQPAQNTSSIKMQKATSSLAKTL